MTETTTTTGWHAPSSQGLVLYEVYESVGRLLFVTSDLTMAREEMLPTDHIVRRLWSTTATPEIVAALVSGGRA